tara:strand:- start:49 stop:585 length:537 start_codon:yes stop_codon:yes gene_type:complete
MSSKKCSRCKLELSFSKFHKQKGKKYGLRSACYSCEKEYYEANKKRINKRKADWYANNKESVKARVKEYNVKEYNSNPNFRLRSLLRSRLWKAINQDKKQSGMFDLLGCTIDELKVYLEKQFTTGMTWDNQGAWHIDHIKPCASFDLTKESEQRKCFHYTNLQPLWAKDNLIKGDKYV